QQREEAQRRHEQQQRSEQAARAFLEDVVAGRVNAAYDATTAGFRRRTTREQFQAQLALRPPARPGINPGPPPPLARAAAPPPRFRYVTQAADGKSVAFTVTLRDEGGAWRVDELSMDAGDVFQGGP